MQKNKVCSKCKETKSIECFGNSSSTKDGLHAWCKECVKNHNKNYRAKNREEIKESKKRYREEHKERISEHEREYYQKNKEKIKQKSKNYRKENREYVKEYNKKYHEENKEKLKELMKRYHEENKEKLNKKKKQYREENKEKILEYSKTYYEENKEKISKYNKKYREENRGKVLEYHRRRYREKRQSYLDYSKENRDKFILTAQRRRARFRNLPCTFTAEEWSECKSHFSNSCSYCGMTEEEHFKIYNEQLHQDHFIPVTKSGGYIKENIVPSCRNCNCSKGNSDFFEWYSNQAYYNKERERNLLKFLGIVKIK